MFQSAISRQIMHTIFHSNITFVHLSSNTFYHLELSAVAYLKIIASGAISTNDAFKGELRPKLNIVKIPDITLTQEHIAY